jgi:hypothetical protein
MGRASIVMSPFPSGVSPFFGIGTGIIHIEPQTTIVQSEDRTDEIVHVGAGFDVYVSQRDSFLAWVYKHQPHVLTSRDDNQEIDEWTAGFSVFL